MSKSNHRSLEKEVEHNGPIWTHPYMLYIGLTTLLFGALVLIAWLAWTNGWIPSRGSVQ